MTNKKVGCLVLFGIFLFVVILAGIIALAPEEKTEAPSETITLRTQVKFDGAQFIITNQDSFDWTHVKMEVNAGLLTGGYILKTGRMESWNTYTVGALQFAKSDGTRLNPFTTKPQKLSIWCDVPGGNGFWYGEWE